jgi:hypothetical protein
MNGGIFKNEKIWRILTNFWTIVFIVFIILDFSHKNAYDFLVPPLSVIYIGALGLYVGTKEFDRWYKIHNGRHPGELFIIAWTALIGSLICTSFILGAEYKIPPEIIAVYIAVLSIFALTQKSKGLYEHKKETEKRNN